MCSIGLKIGIRLYHRTTAKLLILVWAVLFPGNKILRHNAKSSFKWELLNSWQENILFNQCHQSAILEFNSKYRYSEIIKMISWHTSLILIPGIISQICLLLDSLSKAGFNDSYYPQWFSLNFQKSLGRGAEKLGTHTRSFSCVQVFNVLFYKLYDLSSWMVPWLLWTEKDHRW